MRMKTPHPALLAAIGLLLLLVWGGMFIARPIGSMQGWTLALIAWSGVPLGALAWLAIAG